MNTYNILLFGQPGLGKTTIGKELAKVIERPFLIDGDDLRVVTGNTDYSIEGRIKNFKAAIAIADMANRNGYNVIFSLVAPYKILRHLIKKMLPNTSSVLLFYHWEEITRGREDKWSSDFEVDTDHDICIDTGNQDLKSCIENVIQLCVKIGLYSPIPERVTCKSIITHRIK